MLLTIHNLPSTTRYSDVKSLLQEKCGLSELILDNLVNEGKTKKVTVGLADEGDAAILVRKVNGLYINGLQLYVEDKRKKRDSDQPYRSSASIQKEAQYEEQVVNPQHMVEGAMMASMQHPMMMNYNMMGMYMPMAAMDQNVSYMAYGVPQTMPSAEFVPAAAVPNERGFQGDGNAQGRAWDGPQGHNRDRNRRPSPDRPAEAFNRPSRWNEMPAPKDFPLRREDSPPRQTWVPSETNQGPRAPFRQPERPGPRDPKLYPRQPEPEFRRTDAQWEGGPSRWDSAPDSRMRSKPEQEWANSGPNPVPSRSWDEPNPSFEEPNRQWDGYPHRPDVDFSRPDRFRTNKERLDEEYTPNQYMNEPDLHRREPDFRSNEPEFRGREPEFRGREPEFRGREPEFRGRVPELREHEPGFHGQGPDFRGPERTERGYNNDRDRRPRQADAAWNNGNDTRDRNVAPNNWSRDRDRGERLEDRRHIQKSRSEKHPIPATTTSLKGKERHDDRRPNPKRHHSDRDCAPDQWKQVAKDYPASKKPKGPDTRDNFQAPRPRPPIKENFNVRPQPLKPGFVNRPTHPANPLPPPKPVTMKTMINKDQTSRGQATAMLAKEIVPPSALADPEVRLILKELKRCIKGRIDVMLGEELSTNFEDVVKRYRAQFSKNKDRELYKAMREKYVRRQGMSQEKNPSADFNTKPVKNETEVKKETAIKKETAVKEETGGKEGSQDPPPSVGTQQVNIESSKNQTKISNRPLTDKQVISEQKKQRKLEFSKADLFKLDPILDQVLEEELEKLNEIFASECERPADDVDSTICSRITNQSAAEFKKVLRLHITKRILDVTSGLPLRIFAEGGKLPKRTAVKEYLLGYRIERLALKKNKKGTMYIANLSKYADYDHLCRIERDVIDGTPVVFRSMNLLGPVMRMSKNQIQQRRKDFIQKQIDSINPGEDFTGDTEEFSGDIDYTEDVEYPGDVDIDDFNEEDLEDF